MDTLGNITLLEMTKVGYLASSRIVTTSVIPTLEWATEVAKREDVAVMSGFHSMMERKVLEFLLRGRCGIICVLARGIYKQVPSRYKEAFDAHRVLFISNCPESAVTPGKFYCRKRNEFIAQTANMVVYSSLTPDSSLFPLYLPSRDKIL